MVSTEREEFGSPVDVEKIVSEILKADGRLVWFGSFVSILHLKVASPKGEVIHFVTLFKGDRERREEIFPFGFIGLKATKTNSQVTAELAANSLSVFRLLELGYSHPCLLDMLKKKAGCICHWKINIFWSADLLRILF